MSSSVAMLPTDFVDRRGSSARSVGGPTGEYPRERRQFTNSHEELSPPARELATAIDRYKLMHRRRFITYEEMLTVILALGYHKGDTVTEPAPFVG